MECCILCLELSTELQDSIEKDSARWQELGITKVLEKHFWPINSIQQPCYWICLSCWQEVDNFHKFYLRIEEAHFGRVKLEEGNQTLDLKQEISLENNISYCHESEILRGLNELQEVIDIKEHELIDVNQESLTIVSKDPLHKPVVSISKYLKRSETKTSIITKSDQIVEIKTESTDSDNNEFLNVSDDDNKFVADNLKTSRKKSDQIFELPKIETDTTDSDNEFLNVSADEGDNCDKRSQTKPSVKKSDQKSKLSEIETETTNSDSDNEYENDKDNNCLEYKKHKEGDKFIAEHFKQMFCDICDDPFVNFSAMKKHFLRSHSIRNGYLVCCSKKFYFRIHLVDHLRSHLNPDHFKCTECGRILADRLNLNRHMMRVHRKEEIVGKHSCEICGKTFTKAYVLRSHKLTHVPEEDKKYPCNQCGKLYATSHLLKKHNEVVHLKKCAKVCYICGETLGSRAEYNTHMNTHEFIPAAVINCDVCGLRLSNGQSLRLHKKYQHPVGGKEKHPCPLCGKVSNSSRALKKHITAMHKRGLDHKCTICEKAFRRPNVLKEHMAAHTGTPLYTCPWCPKKFNSNGNMHVHRKNKHPKETLELKLQKYN